MEYSVKERLIKFLEVKKISKSEFGRRIGVSPAFITSMRQSMQPDKVKRIALEFPELNTAWLLTGEGEMLTGSSEKQRAAEVADAVNIPADVWDVIKAQAFSLKLKDEQMGRLITQIEEANSALRSAVSVSFQPFEGIRANLDIQNPPPVKPDATR